jgi:glycosyltransferase involved in cell wall biosynthesis
LIISSLSCGGAEKVMSLMANYWSAQGWEIYLITFDDGSVSPHYHLDSDVIHIKLATAANSKNFCEGLKNNIKRINVLRKEIKQIKPHLVISFLAETNVISLIALMWKRIPIIVSERNDPFHSSIGVIWNILRAIFYLSADAIVVQTKSFKNYFHERMHSKIHVIPNPVVAPVYNKISNGKARIEKSVILSVGKLERQKGFDLLIKAFSRLHKKYPHWIIIIIGEGKLRAKLEDLRNSLGLKNKIIFQGRVYNPEPYYEQATIFILPSRYEGFSNALCEAMTFGKAVIATNCPGNMDIIRNMKNGLLVQRENITALTEAMDSLMSMPEQRKIISSQAHEIADQFGIEKIMNQWSELLSQVS